MAGPRYARYQEMEVATMTAPRRVVYLYAMLSGTLSAAARHLAEGEIEARYNRLVKAQDITLELLTTLDRGAGGDIATNLASLYAYWYTELSGINVKPDASRLNRVRLLVDDLHQGWLGAAESVDALEPAAAGAVA